MTIPTLYCAVCSGRFGPDDNHVRVDAERVRMEDRNQTEDYVFHPECWRAISVGWGEPA